ncbi:MAG: hypothetical protein JRI97_01385 [Deltaproteobacteria bacterium]|nr:hypothetical protein [Deltaproteobacteria bacterium]
MGRLTFHKIPLPWFAAVFLALLAVAPYAFAYPEPILDGVLDQVYLDYGTKTRYMDAQLNEVTGQANVPSATMYTLEAGQYLYIYYIQDPYNQNDSTYGVNSMHWGTRNSGIRNFASIRATDNGEFIFTDAAGNVVAHFLADMIHQDGTNTISGYSGMGFDGGDGAWLAGPVANQTKVEIVSTMHYNLNLTGYCAGRDCDLFGWDVSSDSPPVDEYFNPTDPNYADWVYYSGWEIRIDKSIFGATGFGWATGDHHNSPSKMCSIGADCATYLSLGSASIGDRVWYDTDGDGVQDTGEPGISGVTVNLVDPRDGRTIDSVVTGVNGTYVFEQLSNAYYIVQVDETTLPAGFASTTANGSPPNFSVSYVNDVCGADCIVRDGATYTNAYYIDLDAGQFYQGADFGFKPSGAAIGDYVWCDANDNGLQEPGEPGLGGVTVELLDMSTGSPVVSATMTTDPSGRYLFTGVSEGGYKVRVADVNFLAGGPLEGYTLTAGLQSSDNPTTNLEVSADQQLLTVDFGFYKDLGTIGQIVWFDEDNDGIKDPSESGAENVTLDLYKDLDGDGELDPTDTFIAQAVTDFQGLYQFSGVDYGDAAGADYLVTVSDIFNVVGTYALTTYDAGLGRYNDPYPVHLDPSNQDVATANFGYNKAGSIGNMVWVDADQDGVRDAGERGVNGVTISLWAPNKKGVYKVVDTTTTDAAGAYLFSHLGAGDYQVTITVPAGYFMSQDGTGSDWTPSPQGPITLVGRESYLSADFALWQPTYSLGDRVWFDYDEDGVQDATEEGAEGVTVALYLDEDGDGVIDPLEMAVASDTTDYTGNYLFPNLTNGDYIVKVTDTYGMLTGSTLTTGNEPYAHTVAGADHLAADFGYKQPQPTAAVLGSFSAVAEGSGARVSWSTSTQAGTVGFVLVRVEPGGEQTPVGGFLPALAASRVGGRYTATDPGAVPGCEYRLFEVTAHGRYLPLGRTPLSGAPRAGPRAMSLAAASADSSSFVRQAPAAARTAAVPRPMFLVSADRALVLVDDTGMQTLSAADVASALGVSQDRAEDIIVSGNLSLKEDGEPVAYRPAEDGSFLTFFGQRPDSVYEPAGVMQMSMGAGLTMVLASDADAEENTPAVHVEADCFVGSVFAPAPAAAARPQSFVDTAHAEQDVVEIGYLFSDPEADFWAWDTLYAGFDGFDAAQHSVASPGLSPCAGPARLTLSLVGGSDTDADIDHRVSVTVNGHAAGTVDFSGTGPHTATFSLDPAWLNSGGNTVSIKALLPPGAPYSVVYVDGLSLSYDRELSASDGYLFIPSAPDSAVTVTGFSSAGITVFDLSDPRRPVVVDSATVEEQDDGSFSVSFTPRTPGAAHAAVETRAGLSPRLEPDTPSDLKNPANGAEYVVIAPRSLAAGAAELAALREGRGLSAEVVFLQDVRDEFGHGKNHPRAVREFLEYAAANWATPPKYAVLVGKGTLDYKDAGGFSDNLFPPLLTATPDGLFAADMLFAPQDPHGGLAMCIGRLPVTSPEELSALVDKIRRYEAAGGFGEMVLAAGAPDDSGDFPADSDGLASLVPAAYPKRKVYLSQADIATVRTELAQAMAAGAPLVTWMGHGGFDRLDQQGLLTTEDAPAIDNAPAASVLFAMTCAAGQSLPGYRSLSEALVTASGGAVAVWSPSGMGIHADAALLCEQAFRLLFADGKRVLGEVITGAQNAFRRQRGATYTSRIYNLFGDPALSMPW